MGIFAGCNQQKEVTPVTQSKKDKQQGTNKSVSVNIQNGYAVFATIDQYRTVVETDSVSRQAIMNDLNTRQGFVSVYKVYADSTLKGQYANSGKYLVVKEDNPIESDFVSSVVNIDGIVRIANHFYRIDLENSKVYALPIQYKSTGYNDLKNARNTSSNPNIRVFSTEEEVLDIMERKSGCGDAHAEGRKKDSTEYMGSKDRMNCKAVYQKGGIYFSLHAKAKNQHKTLGIWWAQRESLGIEAYVEYQPRCRNYVVDYRYMRGYDNKAQWRVYESSRGLAYYHLRAGFDNYYHYYASRVYVIRWPTP
jgi:hypothetical protein